MIPHTVTHSRRIPPTTTRLHTTRTSTAPATPCLHVYTPPPTCCTLPRCLPTPLHVYTFCVHTAHFAFTVYTPAAIRTCYHPAPSCLPTSFTYTYALPSLRLFYIPDVTLIRMDYGYLPGLLLDPFEHVYRLLGYLPAFGLRWFYRYVCYRSVPFVDYCLLGLRISD